MSSPLKKLLVIGTMITTFALAAGTTAASTIETTINFDDLPPSTAYDAPYVANDGFVISGPDFLWREPSGGILQSSAPPSLVLTRGDGSAFDWISMDVAEIFWGKDLLMVVTGTKSDSSTLTEYFAMLADEGRTFETITATMDFSDITSLTWDAYNSANGDLLLHAFNNIKASYDDGSTTNPNNTVPESGTILLAAAGFAGAAWVARRREEDENTPQNGPQPPTPKV